VVLDARTGKRSELFQAFSVGRAAPTPDGQGLVFQQVAPIPLPRRIAGGDTASWDDLFQLDIASGDIRRLTNGQRTHQPDVSPDGRRIVCTTGARTGSHLLAVLPIDGGIPEVLLDNAPGEIAYSPAWSPDGAHVTYSRFKPGGFHDIHVFDLATRTDRALQEDRALDIEPRYSPDGRFILWSSDRTGVFNVFAHELATGTTYQVTNVIGGAFQPVVSPDGQRLVFTGFTAAGFDLFEMPFKPESWRVAPPFVNTREDAAQIPSTPSPEVLKHESDYQAWKYLYPRAWGVPEIFGDVFGLGPAVRLSMTVSDPAVLHAIGLQALVPEALDPSLLATYSYYRFWPSLNLTLSRVAAHANDLSVNGFQQTYRQHQFAATGSVGIPILRRVASYGDLSLVYQYFNYGPADPLPVADPTAQITVPPETGPNTSFGLGWSFTNAHAWGRSISSQEGRSLNLNLNVSDPSIGSKFRTTEVNWSWREYFTPPWARLHAFAVLYAGGRRKLKTVDPTPRRTVDTLKEDAQWLKNPTG
jgi:hypothetical protein